MKTRNAIIVLAAIPVSLSSHSFAQDPAREFLSGNRTTFSTQNNPKAKGVHLTIDYPSSWAAKEGKRPNVVQNFVSDGGRGLEMAVIVTKSVPLPAGTTLTKGDLKEFFAPAAIKEMLQEGAKLIDAKETEIEGLPAGILEFSIRGERAGMIYDMQNIQYMFIHGSVMVQLQCSVGGIGVSQTDLSRKMATFKPLFTLMANSIVTPDIWSAAPDTTAPASRLARWTAVVLVIAIGYCWKRVFRRRGANAVEMPEGSSDKP